MATSDMFELREARALHRIDAMLHSVAPRRIMTWDEAVEMLFEVREGIDVPEVKASVHAIVDRALGSFGSSSVVERSRVLDPLLDIRSAVEHAEAAAA
jgi:hypothetical protein